MTLNLDMDNANYWQKQDLTEKSTIIFAIVISFFLYPIKCTFISSFSHTVYF